MTTFTRQERFGLYRHLWVLLCIIQGKLNSARTRPLIDQLNTDYATILGEIRRIQDEFERELRNRKNRNARRSQPK